MADYVFHVLHNARPEYERDILRLLQDGRESTYEDILADGESLGLAVGSQVKTERMVKDILQPLRDLGLMERRRIKLTEPGQDMARLASNHPDLLFEMFHYLYYSTWTKEREADNCFSWSYRTLCNHLWEQARSTVDRKALASFVATEASHQFQLEQVSVSSNTINGVLIWLESLSPSTLLQKTDQQQDEFARRTFCPPELFILALDFLYKIHGLEFGTNLILSDHKRDEVCRVCLLEPESFDRVGGLCSSSIRLSTKGLEEGGAVT
ncbi:MAG: hypothetical protein IPO15_15285 [Anaerolineae bacterium]|uniref:hypothetical protein n=1 Tax=Candidatus Amarolinea dominans TaxID=3140696 RepID=UPI0031361142|nr:hypothetical protein [Anaerolineae bacterium]